MLELLLLRLLFILVIIHYYFGLNEPENNHTGIQSDWIQQWVANDRSDPLAYTWLHNGTRNSHKSSDNTFLSRAVPHHQFHGLPDEESATQSGFLPEEMSEHIREEM